MASESSGPSSSIAVPVTRLSPTDNCTLTATDVSSRRHFASNGWRENARIGKVLGLLGEQGLVQSGYKSARTPCKTHRANKATITNRILHFGSRTLINSRVKISENKYIDLLSG